jgi:DNA-binding transcriptional LysR family regulator
MVPCAAPGHPLVSLGGPVNRDDLGQHVQLILSDPVEPEGPRYGLESARLWRFVDLGRRLDFLLAGFGWCRMPDYLVADMAATDQLQPFEIENDSTPAEGLTIYAAYRRDRSLGIAGRWLLDDLRNRLAL